MGIIITSTVESGYEGPMTSVSMNLDGYLAGDL